mmetsp:Transcript_71002/g.153014  ORF Transcript_71002/g.153014 Transcript_71002/m.153014 type:complete len:225 (+) Transcript_71002:114-788(+)
MRGGGRFTSASDDEEEEEEEDDDEDEEVHHRVTCDGCGAGPPLVGPVMNCVDCEDFDFCGRCYRGRDRLGHPRGHHFHARQAAASGGGVGRLGPRSRGGGAGSAPSHLLLHVLESAMLSEALRRSAEEPASASDPAAAAAAAEERAREVISNMPRHNWSKADTGDCSECALCLEEYESGEEVLRLPCDHFFHEECIAPWFAKSVLCPLCQRDASPTVSAADVAA